MKDFIGYYNVWENADAKCSIKAINFKLDGEDYDLLCKIDIIFEHIEEKLRIDLENHFYAGNRGVEYLKTILSNETIFKDDVIPNESTKYDYRVILRIQSVYHRTKDEDEDEDDVKYYPQILLEICVYRLPLKNTIVDSELEFSDNEPDNESDIEPDPELEFDENTA